MKKVIAKWETDGRLAVIYRLDDLLLFYSIEKDPHFKRGEMVSKERAEQTKPYKVIPYHERNIPGDAFVSLSFAWSK